MYKFKNDIFNELANNFIKYSKNITLNQGVQKYLMNESLEIADLDSRDMPGDIASSIYCGSIDNNIKKGYISGLIAKYSNTHLAIKQIYDENQERGFNLDELGMKHVLTDPFMIKDLTNFENNIVHNLHYELVDSQEKANIYRNLLEKSFDIPHYDFSKFDDLWKVNDVEKEIKNSLFLVYNDEGYVGTGNIYFEKEICILDDISVLDQYRGKGYAKQILFQLMSVGKAWGFYKAGLIATDIGRKVYEKLGFETLPLKLALYEK